MLNTLDIALLCDSRTVDGAGLAITPDRSIYGRIYTITNRVNGKQYVGQSFDKSPDRRWHNHIMLANHPEKPNGQLPLYRAMRKHGIHNFEYRVIEMCKSEDELNEREVYWISRLGTLDPGGYNLKTGGYRPRLCNNGRRAFSVVQSKHRYTIVPKSGQAFSLLCGIGYWARENGLSDGTLIWLAKYMANDPPYIKRHNEYACCYAENYEDIFGDANISEDGSFARSRARIKQLYVVKTPDGRDFVPLFGLSHSCRENGLSLPRMLKLADEWRDGTGYRHNYKGWMCCYNDDYEQLVVTGAFQLKHKPKLCSDVGKYVVRLPDGAVVTPLIGFARWCKERGITDFYLREMANSGGPKRKSRSGYSCWLHDDYVRIMQSA